MDPRELQELANNFTNEQESNLSKINAETIIAYIDSQLYNAALLGKTYVYLSYTDQPMKKFQEDSKVADEVESHFSGRGFSIRKQTPENTSPYLDVSY